jgi:hypothetical protein
MVCSSGTIGSMLLPGLPPFSMTLSSFSTMLSW